MRVSLIILCVLALAAGPALADGIDEVAVKRQDIFEFTQKPAVARDGKAFTVTFASKGFCDVSVVVQDGSGRIVRHLAGGVLGDNAPAPLARGSLRQTLRWDGKDDTGQYVDKLAGLSIRVSLGLAPRFERTLFWSPYKRHGAIAPMIHPAPEGVYVFDTRGKNVLRLFDHQGRYVRTVHPAPADRVAGMRGVEFIDPPEGGGKTPVLRGFCKMRFLTASETVFNDDTTHHGDPVHSAVGMALRGKQIALGYLKLNRLATDGTTGGLPLEGPTIGVRNVRTGHFFDRNVTLGPSSMAFSPDGKTLYLAGYMGSWLGGRSQWGPTEVTLHGVMRMDYAGDAEPTLFAGKMKLTADGNDDDHFAGPSSVACDSAERVYVSDYLNDRVQVFSPAGKLLRSIPASKPAKVVIDPRDDTLVVLSWPLMAFSGRLLAKHGLLTDKGANLLMKVPATMTRMGTFDKPAAGEPVPLPLAASSPPGNFYVGQPWEVAVDFYTDPVTVWVVNRKQIADQRVVEHHGKFAWEDRWGKQWSSGGIRLYARRDGEWKKMGDFNERVVEAIHRVRPPTFHNQRIVFNPTDGKLYLLEFRGHLGMKSNHELLQIDPDTGRVRPVLLPMATEDLCFDSDGNAYLRDSQMVMRFDAKRWREIPWDYGEQRKKVGMAAPQVEAAGALATPSRMPGVGHQEGMFVTPRGDLVVSCYNLLTRLKFNYGGEEGRHLYASAGMPYTPRTYPGRVRYQEIHVFDKHGRVMRRDLVPGLAHVSGVAMDRRNNLYVLAGGSRVVAGPDGKAATPFDPWSGTLMKFKPGNGRVTASKQPRFDGDQPQVPLPKQDYPRRRPDLVSDFYGHAWVDGAEWFYGGVGFMGFNKTGAGPKNGGLAWDDWHTRFAFDGHARSFVQELASYSIAVVDSNGNLVMRFGHYGNEQDGKPLVADGGATGAHSIGGSEVALLRPTTLAADSDRRLFITDAGNSRILSVKLNYAASEAIPLPIEAK